jgi:hypothetical protein
MFIECEAKIWEDIADASSPYIDAGRHAPRYYFWGMCKAHKIQECYLSNNFQDDPGLTGIFTHQILFHGQDMWLKSKVESLSDKVVKANTKAQTASGEVKALAKKVKDLESEFKKLKDRS